MFDLIELDQAETALRKLASGELPPTSREETAADRPRADVSRCPFHNGTMRREDIAA